jgi:hypothetical protein
MTKTIKLAGLGAVLATAGVVGVVAMPGNAGAQNLECNANPTMNDFEAAYWPGSINSATVEYIGAQPLCEGVSKTFSLSAYYTEGADWETSGIQKFVGHTSATLDRNNTVAELTVELPDAECYFQTDLYANGLRFDGTPGQGAIPHYPDVETPLDGIDARTGGTKVCEPGKGGGEPTPTPEVLPTVGGGASMAGLLAMGAGMFAGSAAYLRARRAR